jgi:acyl-CoA thioesterase-1
MPFMGSSRLLIALCIVLAIPPGVEGATIVCLGDSITAGLGLSDDQAYPALVQDLAQHQGGLRRLDWLLKGKPDLMLIALGANDGMRGLPVAASRANLLAMLERLDRAQVKAALAGMLLPTNYGEDYRAAFAAIFPAVAQERKVPLLPFLLDGVGGIPALNQADGIHPTAEGQRIIAAHVFAFLKTVMPAGRAP